MSEKVLRAVKIERPETPCVQYMMQVSASFAEDELFPVPEEYIAHILANNLREYVMCAVTDESIATILKSGIPTVCPTCRREMMGDGKMAHSTLTAEQVREVLLYHLPHREYYSVEQTDAWQAIADELNARAERTCRIVEYDDAPIHVCSKCGAVQPDDYAVYFCWSCGAKVRNA